MNKFDTALCICCLLLSFLIAMHAGHLKDQLVEHSLAVRLLQNDLIAADEVNEYLLKLLDSRESAIDHAERAYAACNDWGRGLEEIIDRLKEELEECHGRHNQSEARPGVAYPESPGILPSDEGLDCGGNAR